MYNQLIQKTGKPSEMIFFIVLICQLLYLQEISGMCLVNGITQSTLDCNSFNDSKWVLQMSCRMKWTQTSYSNNWEIRWFQIIPQLERENLGTGTWEKNAGEIKSLYGNDRLNMPFVESMVGGYYCQVFWDNIAIATSNILYVQYPQSYGNLPTCTDVVNVAEFTCIHDIRLNSKSIKPKLMTTGIVISTIVKDSSTMVTSLTRHSSEITTSSLKDAITTTRRTTIASTISATSVAMATIIINKYDTIISQTTSSNSKKLFQTITTLPSRTIESINIKLQTMVQITEKYRPSLTVIANLAQNSNYPMSNDPTENNNAIRLGVIVSISVGVVLMIILGLAVFILVYFNRKSKITTDNRSNRSIDINNKTYIQTTEPEYVDPDILTIPRSSMIKLPIYDYIDNISSSPVTDTVYQCLNVNNTDYISLYSMLNDKRTSTKDDEEESYKKNDSMVVSSTQDNTYTPVDQSSIVTTKYTPLTIIVD